MAVKKVQRWDSLDAGKWMTTPFTKTDEGFLTGRAIVTSVGVFTYLNADGSTSRELRLPEEVFARDSLESMKLKPLANDHPKERITAENAKVYQVGSLGNNPSDWINSYGAFEGDRNRERGMSGSDGFYVSIDLTITDAAAVADVLAGKTALSMGYECEFEPAEPGAVWCGIAYDGIQRNIRYNHCAILDRARAGDAARIRMDGADAVQIYQSGEARKPIQEEKMKKINLDGVEYEGDEGLILKFTEQRNRADTAEKALGKAKEDHAKAVSTLEAERDTLKDRADKAEKDLKEARDAAADPKRIDEAVKAKLVLMDAADRAGVEVKDGMSDLDVKKAVITAVFPTAKLDGKDEVYVTARFDAALEDLEARADKDSRQVGGGGLPPADRKDSASAYQRMVERMKAQSRGDKKEGK